MIGEAPSRCVPMPLASIQQKLRTMLADRGGWGCHLDHFLGSLLSYLEQYGPAAGATALDPVALALAVSACLGRVRSNNGKKAVSNAIPTILDRILYDQEFVRLTLARLETMAVVRPIHTVH